MPRDGGYVYRKRGAGTRPCRAAWALPGATGGAANAGHLDVRGEASARSRHGSVPAWLQHVIVYELVVVPLGGRYERLDVRAPRDVRPCRPRLPRAPPGRILGRTSSRRGGGGAHHRAACDAVWMDILAPRVPRPSRGTRPPPPEPGAIGAMRLQRLSYRLQRGPPGRGAPSSMARPYQPAYAKTMRHVGTTAVMSIREQILWLPAGMGPSADRARRAARSPGARRPVSARRLWALCRPSWPRRLRRFGRHGARPRQRRRQGRAPSNCKTWARVRRSAPWRPRVPIERFEGAWVLMDRIHNADDNGERLFEHLRAERPDINAWFVIDGGTPDWARIRAAGHERLSAIGSFRWTMLMLNAAGCSHPTSTHGSWTRRDHARRAAPDLAVRLPPARRDRRTTCRTG